MARIFGGWWVEMAGTGAVPLQFGQQDGDVGEALRLPSGTNGPKIVAGGRIQG